MSPAGVPDALPFTLVQRRGAMLVTHRSFRFRCVCGQMHTGSPNYGFTAPDAFVGQPPQVKAAAAYSRDFCAYVDTQGQRFYFARALLRVPIQLSDDPFMWGLWVQLGLEDYRQYLDAYERSDADFCLTAWIRNNLPVYPPTDGMPVQLVPQAGRQLATVRIPRNDHRLALDFNEGIAPARAARIAATFCLAGVKGPAPAEGTPIPL